MTTSIGIGIIGCGRVSGHHCRSIRQTAGVSLEAVCDLVPEKAEAYGREFSVPHFTNYHDMLRQIGTIQVVAVITPSGMHFEHASEIIRLYRKHMIIEKPTFMRPSQLVEAYALARSVGVRLFPVFQNRHNRAVQRVRLALQEGDLGDIRIVSIRVRWCRPQRYYDLSPWRGTFAQDGGALTNQGIHHLDLLRYLGGEVAQVNATMRTLGANIEVEDTVVATLTYRTGAVGLVEVTTAARPDDFEASISLVCSKGLAQIGGIAVNDLQIFTPAPSECHKCSEDFSRDVYGKGHAEIYGNLERCLTKGIPYTVSEDDCLATIRLLHAFYRSDEAKSWVSSEDDAESLRLGRPDEALADLYRTPIPIS
jgi:UDP-N-acetyl-2-amino-2-deoxyglucuronate dehydrogenase